MQPYAKYVPLCAALVFLDSAPAFSSAFNDDSAFKNDDEGQRIVDNIVAALTPGRAQALQQIPLDDAVSQGVLWAFHSLYPGGESHLTPKVQTIAHSTSSCVPVRDDAPQEGASSSRVSTALTLPYDLDSDYRQVEKQKAFCQADLSFENMASFLASGTRLLDGILTKLVVLNGQVPGSDTQTTFRAALITAMLKNSLMPSDTLANHCLPGEYLGGLMSYMHASARQYAGLRKGFSLELIRHKNACLGQYGTWITQLRSLTGLEYKSPERAAFETLYRYTNRLWDAFFCVERLARDVGLSLYREDKYLGLLGDARLLYWTANTPAFAQKMIQTWDTLFIYYTHHLLASAANPALDKITDLLRTNGIDLARVNAQPYQTHGYAPLVFIQAPQVIEEESAVDENTVSIKEGETSSEDSNDDADLDAPDSPNEHTPLYPSVLLPETVPPPAFNAFELFMAMPPQESTPQRTNPLSTSTEKLPSCWRMFGVDPEWDFSELCQDDQTGEEGDSSQKDGYNDTND